jgi:SAM-dependent methyltransferase
MTKHPTRPPDERIFRLSQQTFAVDDFPCQGFVLDLGGMGTNVIGILKGERAVLLTSAKREQEQPAMAALRVIMEPKELKFLNGTFEVVTAFFSFMYIPTDDHEAVFREIQRVLKPGGELMVWDVLLPAREDLTKDVFVVPVLVQLPGQEVRTGYGQFWPEQERDVNYYPSLAEKTGFSVVEQKTTDRVIFYKFQKPRAILEE